MNPYEVLGVSPSDDEDTIKKAYRSLVKKYHPDRYVGSPLADEASEKLKEINLAYDIITGKASPNQNADSSRQYYGGYSENQPPSFQAVRMLITMRMFDNAVSMLRSLPQNAEWYYLMGIIYMNKGWYEKAREYIERASQMEPQNTEYQNALRNFSARTYTYRSYGNAFSGIACCTASLCCSRFCPCGFYPFFCYC